MVYLIAQRMRPLLVHKKILLAAILYTAAMTIALLSPTKDIPSPGIPNVDKVVHFVINGVLVFIWLLYILLRKRNHLKTSTVVFMVISCFFYGILIEACQEIFTATRQADFMDVLANSIGLFAGYLAFTFVKRKI